MSLAGGSDRAALFKRAAAHAHLALGALVILALLGPLGQLLRSSLAPITHEQHNWRQADVYSVARAFHEDRFDFFYPRIDFWRGPSGIVGMEAPVYPTLTHFAMYLVGEHPRAGRFVGLIAFFWALTLAARRFAPPGGAFLRGVGLFAFALLSPMGLCEFRAIQPDGLAISGTFAAAALCVVFERTGRRSALFGALGLYSLSVITKSPVLVAGPALFGLAHGLRRPSLRRSLAVAASFSIPIVVGFAWFRWAAHLTATYEVLNPYFNMSFDAKEVLGNLANAGLRPHVFGFLLGSYAMGWALFPLFVAGFVLGVRAPDRAVAVPMFVWLLLGAFFTAAFAYRTTVHWYYAMVAFPPIAYFGSLGLANLAEVGTAPARSGGLERFAASFSILALAATPWIAGPAATGGAVPSANGAVLAKTWYTSMGFLVLGGAAVVSVVGAWFLRPGWVQRGHLVARALAGGALVLALSRAGHDAVEAFRFRASAHEWATFDDQIAPLRAAMDALSTRADLVVSDGYNPWFLHLTGRRGFSVEADSVVAQGAAWYVSRGARFYVHHRENALIPAFATQKPPLVAGERFEIYCLDPRPDGCPRPRGSTK